MCWPLCRCWCFIEFMAAKNVKEIPLAALRTGMTVVKLDISWLDSPFLTHTRKIKGEQDIAALKEAGVKKVVIDLDKSPEFGPEHFEQVSKSPSDALATKTQTKTKADAPVRESEPQAPKPSEEVKSPPKPAQKSVLKDELKNALEVSKKVKSAVHDIQKSLENDTPIKTSELTPLIDTTLESLERNNQALLSLVHLSRKSQKLADHTFGCFCLVLNLALVRNVSPEDRECLGVAALLHEAGWTQIPLQLMGKRTSYSNTEQKLVENHVALGQKVLAKSELSETTLRIIAEHHEFMDGSGYPKGLKKDQIHPLSRLLTVVDAYEERVHQLTDKPGMIPTNAMRSIYVDAEKGKYDVEVTAAFISMLGIYPVMTAVKLSSGERGIIRELHENAALQPSVEVHYGADGKVFTPPKFLDLREVLKDGSAITIDSAFDPNDPALDPMRRLQPEESEIL